MPFFMCARLRAVRLYGFSFLLICLPSVAYIDDRLLRIVSLLNKAGVSSFSVLLGNDTEIVVVGEEHSQPKYITFKETIIKEADRKREFKLLLEGYSQNQKETRKLLGVLDQAPIFGLDTGETKLVGGLALLLPVANLERVLW